MKRGNKKKAAIIFLTGLACILAIAGVIIKSNQQKSPVPQTPVGVNKNPGSTSKKSVSENQGQTAPKSPSFNISLVRAGQFGSGGPVEIRALVDGATSGTCSVTFSKGASKFSKSSSIKFDGRTYSCGSLDAVASEFSQTGSWNYTVSAKKGSEISNTLKGTVTVQK